MSYFEDCIEPNLLNFPKQILSYDNNHTKDYPSNWDEKMSTWTAKDGRVLKVKDMSIDHVSNTVNRLKRRGYKVPKEMADRLKDN